MQQSLSTTSEALTVNNEPPSEKSKQLAREVIAEHGAQISKQENIHNMEPLFVTFFALVDAPHMSQQHLDKIVIERGPDIADFFRSGADMAALGTIKEKMGAWKNEEFPEGGVPQITIKKAANLSRIDGTEDVYSAAYRDLAAIAADKP